MAAALKIEKNLEEAILYMPQKDKDKLLLRLIRKDDMLIKQLEFQLLKDEGDMLQKREALKEQIVHQSKISWSHTPGLVMMEMRDFSGEISRHLKITKDKEGEMELNLLLINAFFENRWELLQSGAHRADKFASYTVKKAMTLLKKLDKIHEDLFIEYEADVNKMLTFIWKYEPTQKVARLEQLPKEWP